MYTIGIFSNISELTTFPFSNIKSFAENNFKNVENYTFLLYTKEQKEIFLANIQSGFFDGIIFATNATNDLMVRNFFEKNKDSFSKFLNLGGGILVLLQYHLAIENKFFEIISTDTFPSLEQVNIVIKQNNDRNNNPIAFSQEKMKFHKDNLFFSYPRNLFEDDKYSFIGSMKKNKWQTSSTPFFAYIDSYPENDFYSIIDYEKESKENIDTKSFCIVSRNTNKRVVYTTLGLDLEENFLLENLISYITRGEPTIFFKSCGKCDKKNEICDFIDLLNNTKIHFSDSESVKKLVKYEIVNCANFKQKNNAHNDENILPIKQLKPVDTKGCISKSINISSVRYMCRLGAQFLKTQLSNGKYGSLIGTLYTLQFFIDTGVEISQDDQSAILGYLESHNKDGRTFDAIREPTIIASKILKLLNYNDNKICFLVDDYDNQQSISLNIPSLEKEPLSEIVKKLGKREFSFFSDFVDREYEVKEFLLRIFSRIIATRDIGKISWENDCFMTSLMLNVLLKIEDWFLAYDEKKNTTCVSKINIITSYFEDIAEISLSNALIDTASVERAKAHSFLKRYLQTLELNNKNEKEIGKLNEKERDFESMENKVRVYQTISIILLFFLISLLVLFIIIVLRAHYSSQNIYDFLMDLNPIGIVLSIASVIIVPFTIGTIYWKKQKVKKGKEKHSIKK